MITVSEARTGDAEAIAALCTELEEFYGGLPEGLPGERAAQVRDALFGDPPLARALVAWDGEAPAGFAAYTFLWPAVGLTASLYLKDLYVAQAYRRTGVGRRLMDALFDVAARRGLSRIEWTTDTSNEAAQAFYASLGARPIAPRIFYREVPRP